MTVMKTSGSTVPTIAPTVPLERSTDVELSGRSELGEVDGVGVERVEGESEVLNVVMELVDRELSDVLVTVEPSNEGVMCTACVAAGTEAVTVMCSVDVAALKLVAEVVGKASVVGSKMVLVATAVQSVLMRVAISCVWVSVNVGH